MGRGRDLLLFLGAQLSAVAFAHSFQTILQIVVVIGFGRRLFSSSPSFDRSQPPVPSRQPWKLRTRAARSTCLVQQSPIAFAEALRAILQVANAADAGNLL